MGRRAFSIAAFVALLALALTSSLAIAGQSKTKVYPPVKEQLPSTKGGCSAGTTKNGVTTIPIQVTKVRSLVEPVVNICFEGKGPYPMLIDTGAEFSVISTELAMEVGMTSVGPPSAAEGAGCQTKTQSYKLGKWSLGGVELKGGPVATVDASNKAKGHVRGSLGADVLSRFGAVRIDFKNQTLILGSSKEGAKFTKVSKSASIPKALVKGKPKLTVPMTVVGGEGVSQKISVKVGSAKAEPWLIDTGAAYTFIDSAIVKAAKYKATGTAQKGDTYCSTITAPEYTATSLALSSGKLKPQIVAAFTGLKKQGSGGIIGSYTLSQYGSVVFDWAGGKLLLGAG